MLVVNIQIVGEIEGMAENQLFEKKRKEQIDMLTGRINMLLPGILGRHAFSKDNPSDFKSQQLSLNAKIGGKHTTYMNVTDDVITSSDEFVSLWFQGMMRHIRTVDKGLEETRAAYKFQKLLVSDPELLTYTVLFLKRTYLRNYYSLSKRRPKKEDAELWLGQRNANYGILITPRFKNGKWENDVSEIHHFQPDYWTIGHIMKTGFVIPNAPDKIEFSSIDQYLLFFKDVLVRQSGSPHEMKIAEMYCNFVYKSKEPQRIPLLIPELRYGGINFHHQYRLDFTIINPYTLQKQGVELSPWSTHGYLAGTKGKSQTQINQEAKANFEKEMQKQKEYFRRYNIFTLIYTDSNLEDIEQIFAEMQQFLRPERENKQLLEETIQEFKKFHI